MSRYFPEVGTWAREIVAKRVGILAGLPAVVTVLVAMGVPTGLTDHVVAAVTSALTLLGLVVGIVWARSGTTTADPALGPLSSDGVPLVPITTVVAGLPEPAADDEDLADLPGALAEPDDADDMSDLLAPVDPE